MVLLIAAWAAWGGPAAITNGLAQGALSRRELPQAAAWLGWSGRLGPRNAEAEFLRARLARHENRLDDVRRHLLRAQELGHPVELLQREQWLALAQSGQMREAEPQLRVLLTDQRDDGAEVCEAYVTGFLLTYQLPKAHAVLDAWQADYPDDPQPHLIRGRTYVSSHQSQEAEQEFRQAFDIAPQNREAAVGLGDALCQRQSFSEAIECYSRVPAGTPEWLPAQAGIARCHVSTGKVAEARALLQRLAAEFPANATILQRLGALELAEGNFEQAIAALRKSNALSKNNQETLHSLASALRGLGETDEAGRLSAQVDVLQATAARIEELIDLLSEQPDDVAARYEIAMLYLKRHEINDGLVWLRSVLQFQPDHREASETLARYDTAGQSPAADPGEKHE